MSSLFALMSLVAAVASDQSQPQRLFTEKGVPSGWVTRVFWDVSKPAKPDAKWSVDDQGILTEDNARSTWFLSEKEYGDFELELDFKVPPLGNSGVALRAPMHGDPAYVGMELQIVDPRYYDNKGDAVQLCGAIYRAIAPKTQAFKPEEWNHYKITCQGPHVKVVLNHQVVQDFNLDEQTQEVHRDQGEIAPPLKERPRKGHIGFQELSREGHVQIRNVTLRVMDEQSK